MKTLKSIFLLGMLSFILNSLLIAQTDVSTLPTWGNPTILPSDTSELWIAAGDIANDIVAIFCQGGPGDLLKASKNPNTSWRYLPKYNDYYQVHLHQSNTYNHEMFHTDKPFTYERALAEVDNTSEIVHRAVSYFKSKGKTVYLFGHSYGAYIIPHYLSTKTSRADKYILCSGRIDDPIEVIEAHKKGQNGYYDFDNGGHFVAQIDKDFSDYTPQEINYYRAKQLIKAAAGAISFSKGLKEVDLLNSIFVYSPKDSRVGPLSDAEITFLESKGVQIVSTKYDHGETIYGLVDAISSKVIKL